MIIRTMYTMSVLMLSSAGVLLMSSATQCLQDPSQDQSSVGPSATEQFREAQSAGARNDQQAIPLIREAATFALYLNPPAPSAPAGTPRPSIANPVSPPPAYAPPSSPGATPWFSLLATSYNRTHPDQSWALVSEPGKPARWAKKGEHLGHFVIETIAEKGSITYRDGNQSREMVVKLKDTPPLAQYKPVVSPSTQNAPAEPDCSDAPPADAHEMGMPDVQPVAQEFE